MPDGPDLTELERVLDEYPWLAEALRGADWTQNADGSGSFRAEFDSLDGTWEAFAALAAATGCELVIRPPEPA